MRNDVRRLRGDLTQEGLGSRLGVSRQTINAIEQGRYDPSLRLALKIGRLFGKPIEEIFHDDDQHGPR
jgi:putative transcriptional regulator